MINNELEFTGERFIPSIGGIIELEHLHRYLMAKNYVAGKVVLDIASGEGYGSNLLSSVADEVYGVDIDMSAIKHAQKKYQRGNLSFKQGCCESIPLGDASVDVVVSFETIEHHDKHQEMMSEIKRVLKPSGMLIISSPDKYEYSDEPSYVNEYHVKELYREEFERLLEAYFKNHIIQGQRVIYGSLLQSNVDSESFTTYSENENDDIVESLGIKKPVYLIAVASDCDIDEPSTSFYEKHISESEEVQSLLSELEKHRMNAEREITRLNQVVDDVNNQVFNFVETVKGKDLQLDELTELVKLKGDELIQLESVLKNNGSKISDLSNLVKIKNEKLISYKLKFDQLKADRGKLLALMSFLNGKVKSLKRKVKLRCKKEYADDHYIGAIDSYNDGYLYGWVCDLESSERLILDVYIGGDLVGSGEANLHREDLIQVGLGDSDFGFKIHVENIDRSAEITLKNHMTGLDIISEKLNSDPYIGSIDSYKDGYLMGWACNVGSSAERLMLDVYVEDYIVGSGEANLYRGDLLQQGFLRGDFGFKIKLEGVSEGARLRISDRNSKIVLPFEEYTVHWHASNSVERRDLVSSMAEGLINNFREEALKYQQHSNFKLGSCSENVFKAYEVLKEGWENRSYYTSFELPKFLEPLVSIVIPVHNKFELTYHCLASLVLANNKSSYEVILVDDVSTDETINISNYIKNVIVIRNTENLGFLRNCNLAAEHAKGKYVVMLNNDTEVTPFWLDELVAVFERFDGVGMVGSKLIYPDDRLQEAGGIVWNDGKPWNLGNGENPLQPEWNYVRQVDYLSGAAFMIPLQVWKLVGGFSEEFAPAYYEDTDLAFKVRQEGLKTVYTPFSTVVHFEGMSNGRDLSQGVKKNQLINAPKFEKKWIESVKQNGRASIDNILFHKDRGVNGRVLMADYQFPKPDQEAGSYAAIQEIRLFQACGFKVSFVSENMLYMDDYTKQLQRMGVECFYSPFYNSVKDVLEVHGKEYDLVYITRYYVAEPILHSLRALTSAKVIFNNADLHFLREMRVLLNTDGTDFSDVNLTKQRELEVIKNVDGILTYSKIEQEIIISHICSNSNMFITPWVLDVRGHSTPFEKRQGIAFLGGYGHPPNVEAVEFFIARVMPLLRRKLPHVTFHVFGSNMPKKFEDMEIDGVIFEGYVKSLDSVFETTRVFIAPLLSGAGIKGKVLESIATGVPSVLSPIAAEGIGFTDGINTFIAEEPEEWVEKISSLYVSKELWEKFSKEGLELAKKQYSFEHGVNQFGKILDKLNVTNNAVNSFYSKK